MAPEQPVTAPGSVPTPRTDGVGRVGRVDDPRDARLVLGGTAAFVLTLPMPWYRTDVPGHEVYARGWQGAGWAFTVVAGLAALSLSALVLARRSDAPWARRAPANAWWFDGVVGGIPLAAVAMRLLWSDDYRSYGLVLGLLAAAAIAFAGGAAALARRRIPASATAARSGAPVSRT
jgi:hypothetical protein